MFTLTNSFLTQSCFGDGRSTRYPVKDQDKRASSPLTGYLVPLFKPGNMIESNRIFFPCLKHHYISLDSFRIIHRRELFFIIKHLIKKFLLIIKSLLSTLSRGIGEFVLEQTKFILNQLKCHGILSTLDLRLSEATTNGWGHIELLSAIISDEKLYRDNHRAIRRVKAAKFRCEASLERFDLTAKRNITKSQIQDLMHLKFVTQPNNLLLLGPTGVGKTYLASAIGHHSCRQGYTCFFIGMNMLIEKFTISRADGSYLRFRDRLIKQEVLIIDDLGLKPLPLETVQDLYDILEERYQKKCTIITSQLPLANWKEVITDSVALEAILDRLIHGSIKLEISGGSYRKFMNRNNKKNNKVDKSIESH